MSTVREQFATYANGHHPDEAIPPPDEPFPVEVLAPAMRAYVEAICAQMMVPPEMIAAPMLAMAGAVIGNRACIQLYESWRELPTLYMVVVAEPGRMKSPALDKAFWPTDVLQGDAKAVYERERSEWQDAMIRWKEDKKQGEQPTKPVMRDYFTTNSTMEKMAAMLDRAPGLLYYSDELAQWVSQMDAYRKGGDKEQYLSIWSGKSIKVDRRSEGSSIFVRRPVVGVVGGIQPDVVKKLHNSEGAREGFVERILPLIPILPPKRWNKQPLPSGVFGDIAELYRTLDRNLPMRGDGDGTIVEMSRGAEAVYAQWMNENNEIAAEVGGILAGFYTKLEAHCARFALILHCTKRPDDVRPMVSQDTMLDAVALAEWFRVQIQHFVPMLGTGATMSNRQASIYDRLIRLIQRKGGMVETVEGLKQNCMKTKEVLQGLHISTEKLTIELDTHNDSKEVQRIQLLDSHIPGWAYCVEGVEKQGDIDSTLQPIQPIQPIDDTSVPWEDG